MNKKAKTENKLKKVRPSMQKKLVVLFVIVLLAFIGLSIRLFLIRQDGDKYSKQILSQQQYDSTTIPFKRGEILDSTGIKLAVSEKVYNLVIDAKVMSTEGRDYLEPTLSALSKCFPTLNMQTVRTYILDNETSQYYVPLKKLTYDEISEFVELKADTVNNPNIAGVWFEEEYKRIYPYSTLASDVVGFVQTNNEGLYGLEEYYNDILNGTNGREFGYLNDDSTLERTTIAASDGYSIVTSINAQVQAIVEKNILAFNEEHKNEVREGEGSTNTAVVMMNPNNGEIIAMADYPSFDLNNPTDLSVLYTEEEIAEMDSETVKTNLQQIWRNFCIFNTYEPGSTAKPFTIATGLEYGKITGNETYECNGSLEVSNHLIHCNNRIGHGTLSVATALEKSCNVALMKMAATIGKDAFAAEQESFNFGLRTNIDLVGETRTDTLIYRASTMVDSDLAIASFGQGYNVSMIQVASAFSSLINGGKYYQPHLVTKIATGSGSTVENIEPRILKQTISEETSDKMLSLLNGVVTNGTGASARPAGYTMGGKTGTAEKAERDHTNYLVSFIGYVPADDPQVVIYVVIDEPNVSKQDKSGYATGLTRAILTEALPYLGIYQTESLSEEEQEEQANLDVTLWYKTPDPTGDETADVIDPETGEVIPQEEGSNLDGL